MVRIKLADGRGSQEHPAIEADPSSTAQPGGTVKLEYMVTEM